MSTVWIQRPQTLILPTAELLTAFFREIGGEHVLVASDLREVLAQIVQVLLNEGSELSVDLYTLPDYDRLIDGHRIESPVLTQAIQRLAVAIRQQLLDLSAYTEEGFPYFFDRLLGHDLVLRVLPY